MTAIFQQRSLPVHARFPRLPFCKSALTWMAEHGSLDGWSVLVVYQLRSGRFAASQFRARTTRTGRTVLRNIDRSLFESRSREHALRVAQSLGSGRGVEVAREWRSPHNRELHADEFLNALHIPGPEGA